MYIPWCTRPQETHISSLIKRYVPVLSWLPAYDWTWLRPDVMAALTVWALLVPEAMAYATLAGVPPQAGLYAAPLALLGYALFGTSRQLSLGPSSTVAIMSAAVVAPLAGGDTERFIALTAMLAIVTGVICIMLGVARAGVLADFMSGPVMRGFVIGLAITIAVGQLDKIMGVSPDVEGIFREFVFYLTHLDDVIWLSVAVGAVCLALLFTLERFLPKLPAALLVVALAIVATAALGLEEYGLHIVGEIPAGLPPFGLPDVVLADVWTLVPGAAGIAIVAFAETVGAGTNYARKHSYELDLNQEFIGIGVANVGSGFSQGFVVDGSLSRSAAADGAGQKTQMASLITAVFVLITVLLLTPLFYYLPEAALGAVVIHAVWGLIRPRRLRRYWKIYRIDFWAALVALVGVLLLGILEGLALAVFLSLLGLLRRASKPHSAELGRVVGAHGAEAFVDVAEHPDAKTYPGVIIYRFDYEMFFANSGMFRDDILALVKDSDVPVRVVIVDAEAMSELDVTALDTMTETYDQLAEDDIALVFARMQTRVYDVLKRAGLAEEIGEGRFFTSVRAAVDSWDQPDQGA